MLLGRNAQGKTNLLESVLFLGLGKSPRTGRDSELMRWGSEAASVAAVVKKRDSSGRLQIVVRTDGPKRITWNDSAAASPGRAGHFEHGQLFSRRLVSGQRRPGGAAPFVGRVAVPSRRQVRAGI